MSKGKLIVSSNIVEQACHYADLGWKVFPLLPNKKTPKVKWTEVATTDKDKITKLWKDNPGSNIGVVTGKDSNLVVLDVDNKNDVSGSDTLVNLQVDEMLDTNYLSTPSNGFHYYYSHPGGTVKNSAGFEPGLDLRGDGGYVVAPPSIINGIHYMWNENNKDLPVLPDWIPTTGKVKKDKVNKGESKALIVQDDDGSNIPQGTRNDALFKLACSFREKKYDIEHAWSLVMAENVKCNPPLEHDEVDKLVRSAYDYSIKSKYELNDIGNSKRLMDCFGDQFKYIIDMDKFVIWKDELWQFDTGNLYMLEFCKNIIPGIREDADKAGEYNETFAKKLHAFANKTSNIRYLKSFIELVKLDSSIKSSELDKNDYLFSVKGGCIDLKTGVFRNRNKDDFITLSSNVSFNQKTPCNTWLKFLNEIMDGDEEMIEYLQKIAGYILTGDTKEQCFFIFYGVGANGKSTFVNVLNELLKDYSVSIPHEILMSNKNSNGSSANPEILKLKGKRMVETGELPQHRAFNESLIKQMTGGDSLTARALYANALTTFTPKFKLIMAGNHKPYIKGLDHGIWRRTHVVPFENTIPKNKIDKNLQETLFNELSGILNWVIEGCLKWQSHGLSKPSKVDMAVEEYKMEQDYIGEWIADCCIEVSSDVFTNGLEIFTDYDRWRESRNETKLSSRVLNKKLEERGYLKSRKSGGMVIHGLQLKDHVESSRSRNNVIDFEQEKPWIVSDNQRG